MQLTHLTLHCSSIKWYYYGFNVRPDTGAKRAAEEENVDMDTALSIEIIGNESTEKFY